MIVRLFDIQNDKVVPTEHCYTLRFLKDIMDKFPEHHLKMYQYLFYMTCPDPDLNPFFNYPENEKEEVILQQIQADFSTDEELLEEALKLCDDLYTTPTYRSFLGAKSMLDKINTYLRDTTINGNSKDGNGAFILRAMKDLTEMRMTYKSAERDLAEEQKTEVRGQQRLSYDQK